MTKTTTQFRNSKKVFTGDNGDIALSSKMTTCITNYYVFIQITSTSMALITQAALSIYCKVIMVLFWSV